MSGSKQQPGSEFVEQMGDFFDRIGQPRIAGRLFGYLLICDPPQQSAADLQQAISASAGSVNSMLRLLQVTGFVDRHGQAGGRKLWYRINPGAFSRVLTLRMQLVSELREMAELGLQAVDVQSDCADRLLEMRDCYAFFEQEFPALVDRYHSMLEKSTC